MFVQWILLNKKKKQGYFIFIMCGEKILSKLYLELECEIYNNIKTNIVS